MKFSLIYLNVSKKLYTNLDVYVVINARILRLTSRVTFEFGLVADVHFLKIHFLPTVVFLQGAARDHSFSFVFASDYHVLK